MTPVWFPSSLLVRERPPRRAGPAAPAAVHLSIRFPGFSTTCCLRWRGDLVQERHGDQPQAARAISSRTPMWWMANGVSWRVTRRYIAWVYNVTSVCLRPRLGPIGYSEGGLIFSCRTLHFPERGRARSPAAGQQLQQPGEQLPAKDPLQDKDTTGGSEAAVAADVGQLVDRVQTDESGSSEDTSAYQDVLEEISQTKEAQSRMQGEIRMIQEALGLGNLQVAAGRLPRLGNLRTLASDVQMLKERLGLYPNPEEVNNMVHWDVLEDCLVGGKGERGRDGGRPRREQEGDRSATTKSPTPDVDTPHGASSVLAFRESSVGLKDPRTAVRVPKQQAGIPSDQRRDASTRAMTQTASQDVQTTSPGTQQTHPESMGTQTTSPGTQPTELVSTGTQTTSLETQPTELVSTDMQTISLGTQPTELESTDMQTISLGTQPTELESMGTQTTRPGTQPTELVSTDRQTTSLGTQPTQPETTGTETTSLGTQPECTVPQTTISGEQLSTELHRAGPLAAGTLLLTAQGFEIPLDADPSATSHVQELALPSGSSSAYHNAYKCYVETVEALKQIGQLRHLYAALKEQVAQLEATRLERTELEKLRLLLQEGGQESIANMLGDLQAQVSPLQGVARDLQEEKGKIRKLESALGKLEAARASWQTDLDEQLSLPLGSTPQQVKRDMKDLAEHQQISKAALDQLVTQMAEEGQEQLKEVRVMENTGQEEAVCPTCSSDTSMRLGKLLRCYEKLQGLVDSLMSTKETGKVMRQLPGKSQDQEELKRIQAAVLQMQGEYEKLNSVMGSLLEDSRQQQKDMEGLLQSVERLEKEKADKDDLELGMDEKADKDTLESKVSRAQFEASLELLNERNQEVLSRLAGQEQGLHEVQQQLREEMASKLDRLELGPFQQELEERWKSSLEQLKERAPPMEADDAAGIRKQLLVDFQCLSCDSQLSMRVPGSPIPPIPSFPPLALHGTGQSHPVLKMEQIQRERMAACRYPTVPRQCGGQRTLTPPVQRSLHVQPVQPSAPQTLQPSTLLPSKVGMKKEGIWWG
ncbi:uncharacterized protein LOC133213889 [Neopsephotus bourkii]|uniref:uncharacterized protein LOC133213889 n=1 Tax=Neopsephotus bourkii TaxID=309878 RepID=UPI002AA53695|nr:uncharacterized protein LOC133213889 [Neopsephotus bourkii]